MIFCDLPYGREFFSLYTDLGSFAARALKEEGGSLVTHILQYDMLNVGRSLEDRGLTFSWPIAVRYSGAKAKFHSSQVIICWKLLGWFTRGREPKLENYFDDFVQSEAPKKEYHKWTQSPMYAEYLHAYLSCNYMVIDLPLAILLSIRKMEGLSHRMLPNPHMK